MARGAGLGVKGAGGRAVPVVACPGCVWWWSARERDTPRVLLDVGVGGAKQEVFFGSVSMDLAYELPFLTLDSKRVESSCIFPRGPQLLYLGYRRPVNERVFHIRCACAVNVSTVRPSQHVSS